MVSGGRFGVGKGALAAFVAASLLANACSGDGDVSFDPPPGAIGNAGGGGNKANTQSGGSGASTGGDNDANSGSAQGGSAHAGNQSRAGNDRGGNGNGGNATAGRGMAGSGTAGDGPGGAAGRGGVAGTAGSTAGSGGGIAGHGGATAGHGGAIAGHGGAIAGHGGATAGHGGVTAGGHGGMGGAGGGEGGGAGEGSGDCVAASFGGHSYYFCGVVHSAAAANTKCQYLGMAMLSVESMGENTFARGKQQGSSWLGGTDVLEETVWRWTWTGSAFWDGGPKGSNNEGPLVGAYDDFLVGQPDNGGGGTHENCLALSASGWTDVACTLSTLRAACESTGPTIAPAP